VLDLNVEPGVVLGELGDLAVAGEVDPRIADLADDDQLADALHDGGRCAHAALRRVDLAHAVDHVAGVLHGAADHGAEAADHVLGHLDARVGPVLGAWAGFGDGRAE
jgi:hypothetical protein